VRLISVWVLTKMDLEDETIPVPQVSVKIRPHDFEDRAKLSAQEGHGLAVCGSLRGAIKINLEVNKLVEIRGAWNAA